MLLYRKIIDQIIEAASEYPVIALIGPLHAGKTTLVQTIFPHHKYVSLEDYDVRELATTDPRQFLQDLPSKHGLILDEIQHAPLLLSYMQTIVDREKKKGFFIVTGSQNFLVDEAITQTLAGRMAVLTLLPLSIDELSGAKLLPERIETAVHKGFYPRAHTEDTSVERLYANYIRLYVERDVRHVKHVGDLNSFQKFMRLCAGRIGQILNITSLANDCGINQATAKAWLSLLEASYIIFLLHPYYKNFGKRLIKSPKLYFVDTGLACNLLKIHTADELNEHYLRGGLVESCIIADLLKQYYNIDRQPSLYFWRDQAGHEIDCIIDTSQHPIPIEIKSGKTIASDFFKELDLWSKQTEAPAHTPRYLIYGGTENQKWPQGSVYSWKSAGTLIKK